VHASRPSADEQAKACSRVLATIGIMEERRIRAAGGAPHISDSPMERDSLFITGLMFDCANSRQHP